MRQIDLLLMSASRPECLKVIIGPLIDNVKYSGKLRLLFHEDVVKQKKSEEALEYIRELGIFDVVEVTRPAQRLSWAFQKMFPFVESELFLVWEDDWVLEQPIYVDQILVDFDTPPVMNQVLFNHTWNAPNKHDIYRPIYNKGYYTYMYCQEWGLGPGIWRKSFIEPKWILAEDCHRVNEVFDTPNHWKDIKWMNEHVGSFFLGNHREGKYTKHIGHQSMWHSEVEKNEEAHLDILARLE